jgi:hypothetical protein
MQWFMWVIHCELPLMFLMNDDDGESRLTIPGGALIPPTAASIRFNLSIFGF